VAVTDNAQSLAADLPAALGDLVPDALTHLTSAVGELPGEADDFGEDELGDGARVGERRVEHGDTGVSGGGKIDLVGSDTEASDGEELVWNDAQVSVKERS
jgi:hypothetical protein